MKDISEDANVSVSTVERVLPPLEVSAKQLPELLCIDEFRGNTGHFKYQVSLMDGKKSKPIDVIECMLLKQLILLESKYKRNYR